METNLEKHTVVAEESKSWYIGVPGTQKSSYRITWSLGMLILYCDRGSITLLEDTELKSSRKAMDWIKGCNYDTFKNAVILCDLDTINEFYDVFKKWAMGKHLK